MSKQLDISFFHNTNTLYKCSPDKKSSQHYIIWYSLRSFSYIVFSDTPCLLYIMQQRPPCVHFYWRTFLAIFPFVVFVLKYPVVKVNWFRYLSNLYQIMREIFSMATSVQLYYEWHTLTGNIILSVALYKVNKLFQIEYNECIPTMYYSCEIQNPSFVSVDTQW
jgi:hypothetical protein